MTSIWRRAKRFGDLKKADSQQKSDFNRQMVDLYKEIYPQHLELMNGIAKTSGLSITDLDMGYMEYMYFLSLSWKTFRFDDFWFANISRRGDRFFIQNTGIRKRKILPQTISELFIPDENSKIVFLKNKEGNTAHLNLITIGTLSMGWFL